MWGSWIHHLPPVLNGRVLSRGAVLGIDDEGCLHTAGLMPGHAAGPRAAALPSRPRAAASPVGLKAVVMPLVPRPGSHCRFPADGGRPVR